MRQLQTLNLALEDATFTNQNIYILYIDFTNAFGSIDHARLLAIMEDIDYPQDAKALGSGKHLLTIYHHNRWGILVETQLIPNTRRNYT